MFNGKLVTIGHVITPKLYRVVFAKIYITYVLHRNLVTIGPFGHVGFAYTKDGKTPTL